MKNNSTYFFGFAVLLLLIVVGVYAADYHFFSVEKEQAQKIEKQIFDKKSEIERARKAQLTLSSLSTNEELVRSYSLSREDIVGFLEALQTTGSRLGSTIQVLSVADDKANPHPRVTISLLVVGTFDSVMKTIGVLENAPYDSSISSLTLSSQTQEKKATLWSAATLLTVGLQRQASSSPTKP